MAAAINEAKKAYSINEVPIACVLVKNGEIIAAAYNLKETYQDPTKHAEIEAIKIASEKLGTWRLEDVDCYVTLEPCHMCASALQQARINTVYFAAIDTKTGAVVSVDNFFDRDFLNHKVEYQAGLLEDESSSLLKQFFQDKRKRNKALEAELGGRSQRKQMRKNSIDPQSIDKQ